MASPQKTIVAGLPATEDNEMSKSIECLVLEHKTDYILVSCSALAFDQKLGLKAHDTIRIQAEGPIDYGSPRYEIRAIDRSPHYREHATTRFGAPALLMRLEKLTGR